MDREICYSYNTPEEYRYRVILWSVPLLDNGFWWVHDTKKDTFRKIGRIGAKRVNYFDVAVDFCESHK